MEGDEIRSDPTADTSISIHSLRMEGDDTIIPIYLDGSISIHSLRMEGDKALFTRCTKQPAFQSTPSAWRETRIRRPWAGISEISIHSLRMEGDSRQRLIPGKVIISIHSLRMEGDSVSPISTIFVFLFQSTPSAWRETRLHAVSVYFHSISIHSLRMEGDNKDDVQERSRVYFNPLPPHGGRLCGYPKAKKNVYFNPLPPHGGRLLAPERTDPEVIISIHSLRMEGDPYLWQADHDHWNFNPLPPHGGRLRSDEKNWRLRYFNPLPPHGGRPWQAYSANRLRHFNPLPPHGGRLVVFKTFY